MQLRFTTDGIHLPALDLWLDPRRARPWAFVSHAHSDHARGAHGEVFCTAPTAEVHRHRGGARSRHRLLDFGEKVEFRGAELSLHPAGHVLGAAQLLVEHEGERLVYTGDLKLEPGLGVGPASIVACDHLVIESTFALPIFRFLSASEARERIVSAARAALASGRTPLFPAYSIGRGPSLVEVLGEAGLEVAVHESIGRWLELYRTHTGRSFRARPLEEAEEGMAIVAPADWVQDHKASHPRSEVILVSGWALLESARTRSGADTLIPWSDHASFEELLAYVEGSGARTVEVVHGQAEAFARLLQRRGIEARAPKSLKEA